MNFFDYNYFINSYFEIIKYLPKTIKILFISVILSLFFGMILTRFKLSKKKYIQKTTEIFTQVIRGTPFIVLLFLLYFGIPQLFIDVLNIDITEIDKEIYLILTLTLFGSSRMSEAMRSAYLAVSKNQMEAALCCNLSRWQGFWHVIFPQALVIALPNLCNLILGNLLETAVGFSIGIVDYVGYAKLLISRGFGVYSLEVYVGVALTYWVLAILFTKALDMFENYLRLHQGLEKKVSN